jgi:hypothetical protein
MRVNGSKIGTPRAGVRAEETGNFMYRRSVLTVVAIGAITSFAGAQPEQEARMRANIVGGGGFERGSCRVEVLVDSTARVEIRGREGILRRAGPGGQPPQWRRFECMGEMPPNMGEFRFAGVRGRGSQRLVQDPRNGGVAVVEINDPQGGADVYTFDLIWNRGYGGGPGPRDGDRRRQFTMDDAIRGCQDAVRQQASQRFDQRDIEFRRIRTEDNPGPRDMVRGVFDVHHRDGRSDPFRFSCSVNFDSGRVFDARYEPLRDDRR